MSAINTTTSLSLSANAALVKAAFSLRIKDVAGVTTPVLDVLRNMRQLPYEFGVFAEQDIRALMSAIYVLRREYVSLQYVEDRPLQDQPKAGSLEANDTGRGDEQAVEREAALADIAYEMAVLERHLESLDKQARSDLEEAGQSVQSGGRMSIMRRNMTYRSYVNSIEDWFRDEKARAQAGSRWMMKLDQAQETLVMPRIDAQTANEEYRQYVSDDRLDRLSHRAWEAIRELLVELGTELDRHEKAYALLNADLALVNDAYSNIEERKRNADIVKAEMAAEDRLHRDNLNRPLWLLGKRFEPVALLAHTGVPVEFMNTPEWRAKESELRAQEAKAKVQEAQASMMEMQANMMELEANTMLLQVRAQMAEMQKAMAQQQAEFKATLDAMNGKSKPKAKADKPKDKADKPMPKGATVINSRGAASATFRPRG